MEEKEEDGLEIEQHRAPTAQAKQANVRRLLERLLMAASEEQGKERVVGLFAVTITAGKEAGLAYAMTADELEVAMRAVPAALGRAVKVVRAAATKVT